MMMFCISTNATRIPVRMGTAYFLNPDFFTVFSATSLFSTADLLTDEVRLDF